MWNVVDFFDPKLKTEESELKMGRLFNATSFLFPSLILISLDQLLEQRRTLLFRGFLYSKTFLE
jgi:hypothetical protein